MSSRTALPTSEQTWSAGIGNKLKQDLQRELAAAKQAASTPAQARAVNPLGKPPMHPTSSGELPAGSSPKAAPTV